jgi:hypothetical protein
MPNTPIQHPSSYRDPSGYIFWHDGVLYRQVNLSYKEHFDQLLQSGCYELLTSKQLLIKHEPVSNNLTGDNDYYTTLRPQLIPFISYPSEWCFDMLKEAALLTLKIAREAMGFNMILKDASPFNVQWLNGKPIFIDSLSLEKFNEKPWIAYRQFCECFLAPLLLMHYNKKQMPGLQLAWPEGIPLDIISSLLPGRSRFSLYTYLHIHLHAKYSLKKGTPNQAIKPFSKQKLLNLISSLESLVSKLNVPAQDSTWTAYYDEASQRNDYLTQKKTIISQWQQALDIENVVDLGANEGEFSRLFAQQNKQVISADFDPYCINTLYNQEKKEGKTNITPLVIDLSYPTPATGVNNNERISFIDRVNADLVLALALIHHLSIGKNIPLDMVADLFQRLGKKLIIEFVPKEDEKVQLMLERKEDIYRDYDEPAFEKAFMRYYSIIDRKPIPGSGRILYLMQKK